MIDYFKFLKPLVFLLDPETAHNLAIRALKSNFVPGNCANIPDILNQEILGLKFLSPVGLAAGFDKNAGVINNLQKMNFGFLEVVTVTPLPQTGNPKPRLFRLTNENAVINCLGFNNKGIDEFIDNLSSCNRKIPIGANIGMNKDTTIPLSDYITGIEATYLLADYITINISSPNTPSLRSLQSNDKLAELLNGVTKYKNELQGKKTPILVKIAPDLSDQEIENIVGNILDFQIDGLIISNTTVRRDLLKEQKWQNQAGGLSGKPLFELSTEVLKKTAKLINGKIPIIGVGGIDSAETAYKKIKSGASLIQIYTGLIYHGFKLVDDINLGLAELLKKDGFKNIKEAIGVEIK